MLFLSVCKATSSLGEMSIVSVLFWLTFSMIGYSVLYELDIVGSNPYFGSFSQSLWSLFVLQTTCNFPDVMLKSYHDSQWVAIYFFIYNLFGMYTYPPEIFHLCISLRVQVCNRCLIKN